ncbi:sensor histidine kinase [Pseudalkalibacillus caeni]|uniref:histidine kinase n=1 Tax=Exobacillus caeni TaxID=2574798 RepID=A0A5R9F6S3_9BACL|nr:HAMP domain-containing sensor histidine kinase [Pseudalkalibacillus caeni]TLS38046.1 HAMP domain-containing histidine kinase [Pseudalkalibacillus caeni]
MIRLNLRKRIWLSFGILILLVGLVIAIIYPLSIEGTLTEETYQIIENEQRRYTVPQAEPNLPPETEQDFIERREAERSVGHAIISKLYGDILQGDPLPTTVFIEMRNHARIQGEDVARYQLDYKQATLFYVIRKIQFNNQEAFFVSYMWDTYRNRMVERLWESLVVILAAALLLSLFPAAWLERYLRQPLVMLGDRFEQIANRNWKEPFHWNGDEEFQTLSAQFEKMRQNLIRYDSAQRTFIQHASHELKTPIMIIQSYAQSIKDGVLPQETTEETMDVIMKESRRMERRVKDMLYYIKLDSITEPEDEKVPLKFGSLAEEIKERFMYHREDIDIKIKGDEVAFIGDREQLEIALDNLVQNALRYAESEIILSAEQDGHETKISVFNDGQPISFENIDQKQLFEPFQKGDKGQFGLGLAIVKKVIQRHEGTVSVENLENGVCFQMKLPKETDTN